MKVCHFTAHAGGPCTRRRRLLGLVATGVIAGVGAPASAQMVDAAALARTLAPDREQKLLAGARKEGEVSVYTSLTSEEVVGLATAFIRLLAAGAVRNGIHRLSADFFEKNLDVRDLFAETGLPYQSTTADAGVVTAEVRLPVDAADLL